MIIFPIFTSCSCKVICGMSEKEAKTIILRCRGEPNNRIKIQKPEGPFFGPTEIWQYKQPKGVRDDYYFSNNKLESSPSQPGDIYYLNEKNQNR